MFLSGEGDGELRIFSGELAARFFDKIWGHQRGYRHSKKAKKALEFLDRRDHDEGAGTSHRFSCLLNLSPWGLYLKNLA